MKKAKNMFAAAMALAAVVSPVAAMADTTTTTTVTTTTSAPFADFDKAAKGWAQDAIVKAKDLGLMTGDDKGNFRPLDTISRQEVASVLVRTLKLNMPTITKSSFSDVKANDFGISAIEAVRTAGIMIGNDKNQFRPHDMITREEMAIIMVKAANISNVTGLRANLTIADKDQVSPFALDYVAAAIENKLMVGDGTKFAPRANAQRQQVPVMALNLLDNIAKKTTQANVLSNPTLTVYAPNVDQEWSGYQANHVFQANVNFATGTTSADFKSAEVSLYNGTTLLATNTAKPALLASSAAGLTDLFGIGDTENTTDDSNWNIGAYNSTDAPTKVVFKLTDKQGSVHTVEAPITTVAKNAAPSVTADDNQNKIDGISESMEYQIDGGAWTAYDAAHTPDLSGAHTVLVRVVASGSTPASEAKTLNFTADLLSNPTLTVYAPNADQEWSGYQANHVFQANVNFATGTTSADFQSAEVSLYNGTTLLATNTAKPVLLESGAVGLTDLFGIGDAENTTDDSNWNIGAYNSTDAPTKVVFKLTDKQGLVHTVEAPITLAATEQPAE